MHIGARVALTVGSLGAGALALQQVSDDITPGLDERTERAQAQTEQARAEWDAWKGGVLEEFPGMRLDTPADHQAFEGYLARNPAPSWIEVSHERYNHVHLDASHPIEEHAPPSETTGYPWASGILAAVAGVGVAVGSLVPGIRPASTAGVLGMTLGGGAALLGGGALTIYSARREDGLDRVFGAATDLRAEVDAAGSGE